MCILGCCRSWGAVLPLLSCPLPQGHGGLTTTLVWLLGCFKPQVRTAKPEGFQVHHGPLDATES